MKKHLIMKVRFSLFWVLMALAVITLTLMISPVSAGMYTNSGTDITTSELYGITNGSVPSGTHEPVNYFYDPDCESCQEAEEFMETYLVSNPGVKVDMRNIFNETGGKEEFEGYKTKFNRSNLYVPVIFIGPVALEGPSDIRDNFADVYRWYNGSVRE